jgi:hypothetical protein
MRMYRSKMFVVLGPLVLSACGVGEDLSYLSSAADASLGSDRGRQGDLRSAYGDATSQSTPREAGVEETNAYFAAFSPKMLSAMSQHLGETPSKEDYANLSSEIQGWMSRTPAPPEIVDIPEYYQDTEGNRKAIKPLEDDASAALALALGYRLSPDRNAAYADKAKSFLMAWATTNKGVRPPNFFEALLNQGSNRLYMAVKGHRFLLAAELLNTYSGWTSAERDVFMAWVSNYFLPIMKEIKGRANNWGDWGRLGSLLASRYLDDTGTFLADVEALKKAMDDSIAASGELPQENLRNNSGMWYTYFALAPMTFSIMVVKNTTGEDLFAYTTPRGRTIRLALDKFFTYCQAPDSWPYRKGSGIIGTIQGTLFPSEDELVLPRADSWPGNLYEVMSVTYAEPTWESYAKTGRPFPSAGVNIWKYPALLRPGMAALK